MFGIILAHLNDTGIMPIKRLTSLLSLEFPHRRMSTTDTKWGEARIIFQNCGIVEAQRHILENLIEGTGWIAEHVDLEEIEASPAAVVRGAIQANAHIASLLDKLATSAANDSHDMNDVRAASLNRHINETITHLLEARQVVAALNAKTNSRRKS